METMAASSTLTGLWSAARYSARALLRSPLLALPIVLCIALVIAANSTVFSVVDALMLRAVPFEGPDRLVVLSSVHTSPGMEPEVVAVSPKDFLAWREAAASFSGMASVYVRNFNLAEAGAEGTGGSGTEPERVEGALVSSAFFSVLEVQPASGRIFSQREELAGGERVAILSDRLWRRRFGGDPEVVGSVLLVDGKSTRIVGIMPPGFRYPNDSKIWLPQVFEPDSPTHLWHYLRPVARLAHGVEVRQAEAELMQVSARLEEEFPDTNRGWSATVERMSDRVLGEMKPRLVALWGGVAFLLLIACTNVANLLLVRGAGRSKEMAVRLAMGSPRRRLALLIVMEGLLLATAGGAIGLALTRAIVGLVRKAPLDVPALQDVTVDYRVIGFTLLVVLFTGLFFGIAPALQAMRLDPQPFLKDGGRGSKQGVGGLRLQGAFAIAQVAMTLVLLTVAGLLVRSFRALESVDPGFEPGNLLTFRVSLPESRYPGNAERGVFANELVERLSALPGVSSAALTTTLPIGDRDLDFSASFSIKGRPPADDGTRYVASIRRVTPGYFRTLGVDLLDGRTFVVGDRADTRGVVVVSRSMAEQFWPGESPLGKQIKPGDYASPDPWLTVVGVVADVKDDGLQAGFEPMWYRPYSQHANKSARYVAALVRTEADPTALIRPAAQEVRALDRLLPLYNVETMEELMEGSLAQHRLVAVIFTTISSLGLVIAALGLYSVMSYVVTRRLQEIGIRMAMGADRKDIVGMVLRRGLILTGIGTVIGFSITIVASRSLSGLLYGVEPMDFLTFAGVLLLTALVAVLANVLPARRATRIDLVTSLSDG